MLVTGPFKVNGVPLRRVNARYVIATSAKVELKGLDENTIKKVSEDGYFTKEKKQTTSGEEGFFKQGEKPKVRLFNNTFQFFLYLKMSIPLLIWALRRKRRLQALVRVIRKL